MTRRSFHLKALRWLAMAFFSIFLSSEVSAAKVHVPREAPYGMASCYVMGDSLAVGIAQQLPQCWSNVKVGLNTRQAMTRFIQNPRTYLAIISLGVNDRGTRIPTVQNLALIRQEVQSNMVIWILPNDPNKRAEILDVAALFQDQVIDTSNPELQPYLSKADHLHPNGTGYAILASEAEQMAWTH